MWTTHHFTLAQLCDSSIGRGRAIIWEIEGIEPQEMKEILAHTYLYEKSITVHFSNNMDYQGKLLETFSDHGLSLISDFY